MTRDPLGIQPAPISGARVPMVGSPDAVRRNGETNNRLKSIWVDHPTQLANMQHLEEYRIETLGQWGKPLDGRWIRELTQAGKSAMAWRLKWKLLEEARARGDALNDHQVLIVTIKKGMTIKGFLQAVLHQMGDDFLDESKGADRRTLEVLEARVAQWAARLRVELLIVEEVQRLESGRVDAKQITEQFQTMLDRGVAPLVLVGTRKSIAMMETNIELCARLSTPLDLLPMSSSDDASVEAYQNFCEGFDMQLVASGIFKIQSKLDEPEIAEPLSIVSGGYIGRTARMIHQAAMNAVRRGATCIEPFDLSVATRAYAISNQWIDWDPFSRQE